MLLNQCLAISLSPIVLEARDTLSNASSDKGEGCDERKTGAREQCSEVSLFRQLIEQNCPTINRSELQEEAVAKQIEKQNSKPESDLAQVVKRKRGLLIEALSRVEFAGFVVPSWLLLSGSYNDLHCIKTSWSEGHFKSPLGFKIETIGK